MIRVWKSIGVGRDCWFYCVGYYDLQYFMILGVFCMGCMYICKDLQILVLFFGSTFATVILYFRLGLSH